MLTQPTRTREQNEMSRSRPNKTTDQNFNQLQLVKHRTKLPNKPEATQAIRTKATGQHFNQLQLVKHRAKLPNKTKATNPSNKTTEQNESYQKARFVYLNIFI